MIMAGFIDLRVLLEFFFPIIFWSAQFCIGEGMREWFERSYLEDAQKQMEIVFRCSSGKVTLVGDERKKQRGTSLEKIGK